MKVTLASKKEEMPATEYDPATVEVPFWNAMVPAIAEMGELESKELFTPSK